LKTSIFIFIFLIIPTFCLAQKTIDTNKQKGSFYAYWGWNTSYYNKSDIHFIGDDFDFVLEDVIAKDRQTSFSFKWYFHPSYFTNPQYNSRIGYFIKDNLEVSFGIDHMKYVVQQNQVVNINGTINIGSDYDGIYNNDDIKLLRRFLKYEHTDGLNLVNISLRHHFRLASYKNIHFDALAGGSIGALVPKTDVTLIEQERHDALHVSGIGLNGVIGMNILLGNIFFIQSELKGGYINMPDVKITADRNNYASQSFFFLQPNFVFGGLFRL